MHKLGIPGESGWDDDAIEHVHPAVYEVQQEKRRLFAGVPYGNPLVFQTLALCVRAPFSLLYILHTPRGEAQPGRYESPLLSEGEFLSFMNAFGTYLGSDGRSDIWVRSHDDDSTIAWDRHNYLFAYGALEKFRDALALLNFSEGRVPPLGDHVHHYRRECDKDARAIFKRFDWHWSPLQPQDEQ